MPSKPTTRRQQCSHVACVLLAAMLTAPATGSAQSRPRRSARAASESEDRLPLSDFDDDPIGVGARREPVRPEKAPDAAPVGMASDAYGPNPPPLNVQAGPALTALAGVHEVQHRVSLELKLGVLIAIVEQRFESRRAQPAELHYALPVPDGSVITAFQVCGDNGCRKGRTPRGARTHDGYDALLLARGGGSFSAPVGRIRFPTTEQRDPVLELDVAPVLRDHAVTTRIELEVPVREYAGMIRTTWPARGMDPNAAPMEMSLSAHQLLDPRVDGWEHPAGTPAVARDPWLPTPITARVPSGAGPQVFTRPVACADGPCVAVHIAAGPARARPVDAIVAVDVSPSMEGPARSRLAATMSALLSSLPPGSRLRVITFASRAERLFTDAEHPDALAIAPIVRASRAAEQGSATRLSPAIALATELWSGAKTVLERLLIVVGDGGLTMDDSQPFQRARRERIRVSVVNIADRTTTDPLLAGAIRTGGLAIEAGPEAEAAMRGHGLAPLEDRLDALFAPTIAHRLSISGSVRRVRLPDLRAGHSLIWRGPVRGRALQVRLDGRQQRARRQAGSPAGDRLLAIDAADLAPRDDAWPDAPLHVRLRPNGRPEACDRRGPAHRPGGLSSDAAPVHLAIARTCQPPDKAADSQAGAGAGMPASPLLDMLRQRIIPVARGCLRRDRAGRADYAVRAVYRFTLAEREIVSARVEGQLAPGLRACLREAIDTLLVPRFDGTVTVTYPIYTEKEPLPSQIDLSAGTAGELDRLLDEHGHRAVR